MSDVDANGQTEKITLKVGQGTLALATVAGLKFDSGFGNGSSEIHMTGTIAALDAALKGMRYIPKPGTAGADSLRITVDDSAGVLPLATKTVNLSVIARPPVVMPPAVYQVQKNTPISVAPAAGVLATVRSPDAAPLTVIPYGILPTGLKLAANGSFTYTPPTNFVGVVTFEFEVMDGIFTTGPIMVTIDVTTGGRGRG